MDPALEADVVLIADCWYHQAVPLRHAQAATAARLLRRVPGSCAWSFAADRGDGAVALFREAFEAAGLHVRPVPVRRVPPQDAIFPFETSMELLAFEITACD